MPANLCKVFRELLTRRMVVGEITCRINGYVGPSLALPMHQRFQRHPGGADTPGGGAELGCQYLLQVSEHNFIHATRVFKEHLPRPDLERLCLKAIVIEFEIYLVYV